MMRRLLNYNRSATAKASGTCDLAELPPAMKTPDRLDSLQQGFVHVLGNYGVNPGLAYPVFDLLVAAYSSPDRHYHTLDHVQDVLQVAFRLATLTDAPGPLHLAIWFHDAVYDSRALDNEARSAELAASLLGPIGVPASVLERLSRLIMATAHLNDPLFHVDREMSILLDADLAILGASSQRYQQYVEGIRKEYAWVPDDEYRIARGNVLVQFLNRPRIYRTELMIHEYEAQARSNMMNELNRWRS